jgi:hypothetical protein
METMTDAQRFYSQPAPRPITRQDVLDGRIIKLNPALITITWLGRHHRRARASSPGLRSRPGLAGPWCSDISRRYQLPGLPGFRIAPPGYQHRRLHAGFSGAASWPRSQPVSVSQSASAHCQPAPAAAGLCAHSVRRDLLPTRCRCHVLPARDPCRSYLADGRVCEPGH